VRNVWKTNINDLLPYADVSRANLGKALVH
jgi:hypothetical protein